MRNFICGNKAKGSILVVVGIPLKLIGLQVANESQVFLYFTILINALFRCSIVHLLQGKVY